MLILPIKRKWFDMIRSGEKEEEYREIKPYWTKRFIRTFGRHWDTNNLNNPVLVWNDEPVIVTLKNGYGSKAPEIDVLVRIKEGIGNPDWGAEPGITYYILEILEILKHA